MSGLNGIKTQKIKLQVQLETDKKLQTGKISVRGDKESQLLVLLPVNPPTDTHAP